MVVGSLLQTAKQANGRLPADLRDSAREQMTVAVGHVIAGVGNLAFAVASARIFSADVFVELAAFLAVYVLVHMPMGSVGAGGAVDPGRAHMLRRRSLAVAAAAAVLLVTTARPVAALLNLPTPLVIVLAAGLPLAPVLAVEQGRLFAARMHRRAALSLVVEPVTRLAVGLPLGLALGAVGGAVGVVAGGLAALVVTAWRSPGDPRRLSLVSAIERRSTGRTLVLPTVAAFMLLAVLQQQDLLLANRLLERHAAAVFATVSTLGGAAVYATVSAAPVLLPRAVQGSKAALSTAIGIVTLTGAVIVTAFSLAPVTITGVIFGPEYAAAGHPAVPYLIAMTLLGVVRVLSAHWCAVGRGAQTAVALAIAAACQAAFIVRFGDSAAAVVACTGLVMLCTAAALAAPLLVLARRRPGSAASEMDDAPSSTAFSETAPIGEVGAAGPARGLRERGSWRWWVYGVLPLTAVGAVLRIVLTRGIWLDEAISVAQAQMLLGDMIQHLRFTDVHPPLHYVALWVSVRHLGTGELAVRLPSIVAGTAVIPLLWLSGRYLYDRRTGLIAAAFGTFAPLMVWYSHEARMYSLFMLLGLAAIHAQALALRTGKALHWLYFVGCCAALVWTQYFALLQVAAQFAYLGVSAVRHRSDRRRARRILLGVLTSAVLIAALVSPLVGFAQDQFVANERRHADTTQQLPVQAGQLDVEESEARSWVYTAVANVLWATTGYHSTTTMAQLGALWPLLMLGALVLLGKGWSPSSAHLSFVVVSSFAALLLLAVLKWEFVFEVRYFAGVVPLILLLISRFVATAARRTAASTALTIAFVALLSLALVDQQVNSENPRRYDFDDALATIRQQATADDVIVHEPAFLDPLISYYAPTLRLRSVDEPLPDDADRVFLVASFLDLPDVAAQAGRALTELQESRQLRRHFSETNVEVWVFE